MNKDEYKKLDNQLPIFFKSWWLDAVSEGGEWLAESYRENGVPQSVFVCFVKRKFGLRYIVMPPLTQFLGEYSFAANSLTDCKKASNYYIDRLPKTAFASINMSHTFRYWSPYHWRGYSQTTRYSFVINDLSDIDAVFCKFDDSKKRNIRKASKSLTINNEMTGEEFYSFFEDDLRSKNQQISYSKTLFLKLYDACVANNAGAILQAVDSEGVTNGALFVVWDSEAMYALTYTFPDKYRSTGVGDFLMFNAIKLAATVTKSFDFEGSMIENVEQSYRRFGATPVEYFQISRINNPLLKILHSLKPLF